jgi:hypothetical protein
LQQVDLFHLISRALFYCHKINGDKLWEFQDVAIIRKPRGVAVDKDLNGYVTSLDNNSVVVISPDGKRCRTVLGKSDGIDQPVAICFDKVKNNLVVCKYDGTVFLYKVDNTMGEITQLEKQWTTQTKYGKLKIEQRETQ